jgi:hypothetical protein
MIQLGESELDINIGADDYFDLEDEDSELDEESDMMGDAYIDDSEETIYEIYMDEDDDEEDFQMNEDDDFQMNDEELDEEWNEGAEMEEMWGGNKHDFKRRHGHKMGDVDGHYKDYEDDEMELEEDMDADSDDVDTVMEAIKKSIKPKGVGIGKGPKFSYDKKPNMGGGFNEKRKEAFGKGTKAMGTGKAKFEYKEGENMEKGSMKKVETKEASRTYGNGSKNGSRGLRKAKTNNRNYEYNPFKLSESQSQQEVQLLKEFNINSKETTNDRLKIYYN